MLTIGNQLFMYIGELLIIAIKALIINVARFHNNFVLIFSLCCFFVVMKKFVCFILFSSFLSANAQSIGYWKDYLPYSNAIALCGYNKDLLIATENALFLANKKENNLQRLSKVEGLSDIGISSLNSVNESLAVVGYSNGNIDILEGYDIHNIPHVKNEVMLGEKRISAISFKEGFAYLSCSFGIVELNLIDKEISNTFLLNAAGNLNVNELAFFNDSLFAATDSGLYKASALDNLSDFHSWNNSGQPDKVKDIAVDQSVLYYTTEDSLYVYGGNNSIARINNQSFLESTNSGLFLLTPNQGYLVNENGITQKHNNDLIRWASDIYTAGDTSWFADNVNGLIKKVGASWEGFYPEGPTTKDVFSIYVNSKNLWVAPGGIDAWNNANVNQGVFWSDKHTWKQLSDTTLEARDVVDVVTNPNNSNEIFLATWNDGVIQLNWSNDSSRFEKTASYDHLNTNGHLATLNTDSSTAIYGWIRVKSIVFDNAGNLWGANSQVNNPLFVRKNNGDWHSFSFTSANSTNTHLGNMIIDNIGQKWVVIPAVGLVVYNDNNTIETTQDDQDKVINSSLGSGNLPSTNVYSLAKDRDGEVWVGTNKGVAVFFNPENVFTGYDFDAQQILVDVDGYVEYLLANEIITAISVDAANRKWLGTQSAGVFLVSPDGTKQIHHFTEENSPLFSNTITDIAINNQTGEVYIGTSKGLISFMSDATEGYDTHQNVKVYPNPVRPEFNGTIAIKGLVEDADVKITDLNGTLVYETTALGGQAVWDGKNGYGERVHTGVYLVFSSNSFGTETNVAKILFVN